MTTTTSARNGRRSSRELERARILNHLSSPQALAAATTAVLAPRVVLGLSDHTLITPDVLAAAALTAAAASIRGIPDPLESDGPGDAS